MEASGQKDTKPSCPSTMSRFLLLCHFFQSSHVTPLPGKTQATQGKQTTDPDDGLSPEELLSKHNLPIKLPSIIEIKRALPQRCFEPVTSLSLYYMFKDFFLVTCLYFMSEWTWKELPLATQAVITPVYWLLQGTIYTGIFVVGHDAGHGSFSNSELVNTICGNICHSFLFCPYYMWKISHKVHHKNTGNIDKDEVFYPVRKSQDGMAFVLPGFGLGVGWFAYLFKGYKPRGVEHFNPYFPLFNRHLVNCIISMACLITWALALVWYVDTHGLLAVLYHHAVPTFIFGSFTVIITFLHHSEQGIPWYGDKLWDNVRGQLSSVDRSYGWCHGLIHNIGTHQIHHLFPKIPHYRLEEATAHFRKTFPSLVNVRNDRILPAFCKMFIKYLQQMVVEDTTTIHVYN